MNLTATATLSLNELANRVGPDLVPKLVRVLIGELDDEARASLREALVVWKDGEHDGLGLYHLDLDVDVELEADEALERLVNAFSYQEVREMLLTHRHKGCDESDRVINEAYQAMKRAGRQPRELEDLFWKVHGLIL